MNRQNGLVQINAERLKERLCKLGEIGRTADGGVTRLAYTEEYRLGSEMLAGWMREAGMEVKQDCAGNLIGFYGGKNEDLPVVMLGSHLDTVINGGKFDGALGIVAGLECIQSFAENNIRTNNPLVLIAFIDEEGTRFNQGYFGSSAIAGNVGIKELGGRDSQGISRAEAMREYGLDPDCIETAKWDKSKIKNYFELHVEQGNVLESLGIPLGIVKGIAAPNWFTVKYIGQADHAGATPMNLRRDALAGAAELILAAETIANASAEQVVVTVGQVFVKPGSTNIIPGTAELSFDIRHFDKGIREDAVMKVKEKAQKIAAGRLLKMEIKDLLNAEPVTLPGDVTDTISQLVSLHGIKSCHMISGAGHDAMVMAGLTKVGMLFVPSHKGLSHCPQEWTDLDSCKLGAEVLASVLLHYSNSE